MGTGLTTTAVVMYGIFVTHWLISNISVKLFLLPCKIETASDLAIAPIQPACQASTKFIFKLKDESKIHVLIVFTLHFKISHTMLYIQMKKAKTLDTHF